jgi:hypothetical protein
VAPPGLPVTALMVAICAALGALAAAVAARQRGSWPGAYALLLSYAVVAAPKNSIWNFAPLLIAVVLTWTLVRDRPIALALLALAWTLIDSLGAGLALHDPWLASLPLYGALLLGGLLAWALLRRRAHDDDQECWTWSSAVVRSSTPAAPSAPTSGSRAA